jgi:hypothetical protein
MLEQQQKQQTFQNDLALRGANSIARFRSSSRKAFSAAFPPAAPYAPTAPSDMIDS